MADATLKDVIKAIEKSGPDATAQAKAAEAAAEAQAQG